MPSSNYFSPSSRLLLASLCCLAFLAAVSQARSSSSGLEQMPTHHSLVKRSRVRLCGQQLVEMIKLVCRQAEAMGRRGRRRRRREADPAAYFQLQRPLFTSVYSPLMDEDSPSAAAAELGWRQVLAPFPYGGAEVYHRRTEEAEEEDQGEEEEEEMIGGLSDNVVWRADRFGTVAAVQSVQKRGAADQCCARSCTIAHLRTYC